MNTNARRWTGVVTVVAIVVLLAALSAWRVLPVGDWLEQLHTWITGYGAVGVLVFALVYVVAVVMAAPASPLSVMAGVAFGLWAIPLVVAAATAGATAAFLVARYLLREHVEAMVERRPRLKALEQAVNEEGWKLAALLHLSPVVPFSLQNYFFGITKVPLKGYVSATAISIIPGSATYVYLGTIGGRAVASAPRPGIEWVTLIVGLVATVAATVVLSLAARRQLRKRDTERPGPTRSRMDQRSR